MARKRLTQRFPWLLPLRRRQRRACFYLGLALDGRRYARQRQKERLPCLVFESRCPMINERTGFDLRYQENKVFNLKLAARQLDGLLIRPGESFSFWLALRGADRETPYKEGLAEIDGRLMPAYGGGLCMLSNLLFWALLHTELTVLERHGHRVKAFPEPESDAARGTDAAVAEGWLDLKFYNGSRSCFQLEIGFEAGDILCRVYTDSPAAAVRVFNGPARCRREAGGVWEEVPVLRQTGDGPPALLYTNRCRIGYRLPADTIIEEAEK